MNERAQQPDIHELGQPHSLFLAAAVQVHKTQAFLVDDQREQFDFEGYLDDGCEVEQSGGMPAVLLQMVFKYPFSPLVEFRYFEHSLIFEGFLYLFQSFPWLGDHLVILAPDLLL